MLFTPPEETEDGTRPGGRGPGVVPGGVGSKNRGGHVRVYRGGSISIAILSVCLCVCLFRDIANRHEYRNIYIEGICFLFFSSFESVSKLNT